MKTSETSEILEPQKPLKKNLKLIKLIRWWWKTWRPRKLKKFGRLRSGPALQLLRSKFDHVSVTTLPSGRSANFWSSFFCGWSTSCRCGGVYKLSEHVKHRSETPKSPESPESPELPESPESNTWVTLAIHANHLISAIHISPNPLAGFHQLIHSNSSNSSDSSNSDSSKSPSNSPSSTDSSIGTISYLSWPPFGS